MAPIPLPDNPFQQSAFQEAYNQCLALQAEAEASQVPPIEGCPPPIVCARVLGHLLRLAPPGNPQGQVQLEREIALAKSDRAQLMKLAAHYVHSFILAFKRSSGPTPVPSEHPSHPSFEDFRAYAMHWTEERTLDNRTARTWAMHRDNNFCMITGKKDYHYGGGIAVQTAHIIPASVNVNIETNPKRPSGFHHGGVSILSMFSEDAIIPYLAGNRINRLENIISLRSELHIFFDELMFWLKPVEDLQHTYRVCVASEALRTEHSLPEQVAFSTNTELPLPRCELLALHALCCEVAWMSGAAEYIMDIERRMDDTNVLANDGSSFDVLMVALSPIAQA